MNLLPTPHLDSALQNLAVKDPQKWSPVRLWLDFVKIFLAFAQVWGNVASATDGAREHLRDLPGRITTELENIEEASKKGDTAKPDVSRLPEMMAEFNPRIMSAYKFLSGYAFKNNTLSYVILREQRWFPSFGSLLEIHSASSKYPLYNEFQMVLKFLEKLQLRQIMFRDCELFRDPCIEHGGVAICLAGLMFSCWAEEGENATLSAKANLWDLVLKIKPTSPGLLAQYLEAIKSQIHSLQEELMVELVKIALLAPNGSQKPPEIDSLVFLIRHSVHSPAGTDDGEIISILCKAAAAFDPADSLQKAELLRTKMLLAELGDRKSICERPRFEDAYSENMMQILEEMETLMMISPKMGGSSPYVKVSLDFYIALFQAFLTELMSPSSVSVVKIQVQELCNESKRFRRYSSILPLRNSEEMKLISVLMGEAADVVAETLPGFFQSNHVPEQHMSNLSGLLSKFLEKLTVLNGKMEEVYLRFRKSSMVSFPKTLPGLSFVESFLERLTGMTEKVFPDGYCIIKAVLEGEDSLAEVLKLVEETEDKDEELTELKRRVTQAAYEADYIIDSMLVLDADPDRCHLLWLSDAVSEMNLVKADLMKFCGEKKCLVQVQGAVKISDADESTDVEVGEYIVPLDVRVNDVVNDLLPTGKSDKYIVGIVGMPGIGKTTLARMVYDHLSVSSHFDKFAWCTISQEFRMRDVLVKILRDIDYKSIGTLADTDDENKLLTILDKELQEKTYLIVMDDVWSEDAWTRLNKGLPKREGSGTQINKSRILFTSRNEKVLSLNYSKDVYLYSQKPLDDEESWMLLQRRVFGENHVCPEGLRQVGRAIATNCQGLPLSVVTVSGILRKKEQEPRVWDEINKRLSSIILDDSESPCNRILELSYSHLPDYLKPCLLYFAAFREDQEIQVNRLIRLWISEGFVRQVHPKPKPKPEPKKNDDKVDDDDDDDGKVYVTAVRKKAVDADAGMPKVDSLEDVALKYVDDLTSRSLIIAYKKSVSTKKVKVCKIHDLLHNLCLAKAKKDNFFESVTKYSDLFPPNTKDYGLDLIPISNKTLPTYTNKHRLGIYSKRNQFVKLQPSGQDVRTLLFSADTPDTHPTCPYDVSFIPRNFKILKVLDIGSINLDSIFPEKILDLDPLRYLAVEGNIDSIPPSIKRLQNLEDFTVTGLKGKVALPSTIWTMSKLRHLHVSDLTLDFGGDEYDSFQLHNLRTLSLPDLSQWDNLEDIMRKAPQLRKLKCTFSPDLDTEGYYDFECPEQLLKLESLKVIYTCQPSEPLDLEFPKGLNKLSLKSFCLTLACMSSIGNLPRLEFLTLDSISFKESYWKMGSKEFEVLKTLKLYSMKLQDWEVPSSNFVKLKQLVLRNFQHLDHLPDAFVKISDIEEIELIQCSDVTELAGFVNSRSNYSGIEKLTITVNGIKISPSTLLTEGTHLF